MEFIESTFSTAQQWLYETLFQPVMFHIGLGQFLEDGYAAAGWFLVGLIQLAIMLAVIAPLEKWRPVEPVTDRQAIRVDILYTLIHRLGLFRVALFFTVDPLFDELFGWLRVHGVGTFHLDQVWPGVTDIAWVSLLLYLVVFDFVDYWIHRGQHHFEWWWALHSLHHSQRQMTMWSDNRNHLLDDLIRDTALVVVGQLVGVGPGQFVAIVAITQLSESLQHANLKLSFGRIGERLWVSPRFHRLHHRIGLGHESAGEGTLGGHNFGVLLPWWDMSFRTVNLELQRYDSTGVRDQVQQGRDYGRGVMAQQLFGLIRMWRVFAPAPRPLSKPNSR